MNQISRYLRSVGKEMKFINVEGANLIHRDKILAAVMKMRDGGADIEAVIIGVSIPDSTGGAGGELVRWPCYDVEFKVDNRSSGAVGATGDKKNILKCLKILNRK